jgi:arylsulfatase
MNSSELPENNADSKARDKQRGPIIPSFLGIVLVLLSMAGSRNGMKFTFNTSQFSTTNILQNPSTTIHTTAETFHELGSIENQRYDTETSRSETTKQIPKADSPPESNLSISQKKLNIVLLYADDWSFNMLGAMEKNYVKTPVLDQLAKEGVHFTHNCVVTSVCMQSRATLYTGQYSSRHRTFMSWSNITMYEPERWNNTLYPLMMREDYHVGYFGKYHHLEPPPPEIPAFSSFKSLPLSHYFDRQGVVKHVTEWNEEDGLEFLDDRPRDKPFFLTISFFATHAEDGTLEQYRPMNSSLPLYADDPVPLPKTYTQEHWEKTPYFINENNEGRRRFNSRYQTDEMYQHHMKNTCRMVTEVDTACGNIIRRLKE